MTLIPCPCGHDARKHSAVGCQVLTAGVVCPCRRSSAEIAIAEVEHLRELLGAVLEMPEK